MPVFAATFHVSAAASSLPLSLTTGLLAPAMMIAGAISEARGRKNIMAASLGASSALMIVAALATRWDVLLAARALAGITFAGLPAVSVAYLSEEVDPASLGLAIGLMIGGNGLGGMSGRLLTSAFGGTNGWRWALGGIAVLGLVATFVFLKTLPSSRRFVAKTVHPAVLARTYWQQ
ncbi:MAG: MFS transporter, partial [bacterium]